MDPIDGPDALRDHRRPGLRGSFGTLRSAADDPPHRAAAGAWGRLPAPLERELARAPEDPLARPTRVRRRAEQPRRVLFFGKSKSRSRCTGGLVDALRRNGLEVRWRNLAKLGRWVGQKAARDLVRREFDRWQPDLVFVFFMDLPGELLDEFRERAVVVQWVEEAFPRLADQQIDYVRRVDLACFSDPELLPQLRAEGIEHGCFQMSGFSTRYHFPIRNERLRYDVSFIGGPGADRQRARFLLGMADAFPIDVFGLGWDEFRGRHPQLRIHAPIDNRGYRRVCARSRVVLGMNQFNGDRHYFSNRIWLTLACRGFHLTHHVPGIEDVFRRGQHLDWFSDLDEAVRLCAHYLEDDERRRRIAERGWRYVVTGHQYLHRVAAVLTLLEGRTPQSPFLDRDAQVPRLDLIRGKAASE
jgi:hypothetical protein